MNKYFKGVVLAAAFFIPIVIFLFLKFFGENKFDIPLYYQTEITAFDDCESVDVPYYIEALPKDQLPGVFLFLAPEEGFGINEVNNVKQRLKSAVKGFGYSVKTTDSSSLRYDYVEYIGESELTQLMHCKFITDTLNQYVLVDSKARIRGYYNSDREEVDRLIVELKILLENERSTE